MRQTEPAAPDLAHLVHLAGSVLDTALEAIVCMDAETRILWCNAEAERTFGWTREEVAGRRFDELGVPEPRRRALREAIAAFLETGESPLLGRRLELDLLRSGGDPFPVEIKVAPLAVADGWIFNAFLRDLTARRRVVAAAGRHAAIVESSSDAIYSKDLKERIVTWNRAAEALYGYTADEAVGRHISFIIPPEREGENVELLAHVLRGEPVVDRRTVRLAKDGSRLPVSLTVSPVRDWEGAIVGASMVARDLRERIRLEEAAREAQAAALHRARHDELTGMPDRRRFLEIVGELQERRTEPAVAVVALQTFAELVEALGSEDADELLLQAARALERTVPGLALARIDRAVFGLALADAGDDVLAAVVDAARGPFAVRELEIGVEVSAGVVRAGDDDADAHALLQRAFRAAEQARRQLVPVHVYDPAADARAPQRPELLTDLRRALDAGHVVLFFQPQIQLATGTVAGFEGLMRWRDPDRGLIPPGAFLPAAERSALIRPLTLLAIELAARQAKRWYDAGTPVTVAANVSAVSLLDLQIAHTVAEILSREGLPPELLMLEVTESAAMLDPRRAAGVLAGLRAMGVKLSIDDFGTGHSSLAYLQRLPVDELKIDRSFVARMTQDRRSRAVVRATVDLARSFGLRQVAEGVEDEPTVAALAELGCDTAQGFLFARPLPREEAEAWLRDRVAAGAAPRAV